MSPPPTSYAELGLSPDADRGAVDRAYRALMKLHHPDRGGDPMRAAAINRAYAEITRPGVPPRVAAPPDLADAMFERRVTGRRPARGAQGTRKGRMWVVLLVAVAGAITWLQWDGLAQTALELRWRYFPTVVTDENNSPDALRSVESSDSVDALIHPPTIVRSVASARAAITNGGLDAASDASSRCYHGLANAPSFAALDGCLAFDDAVMLIAGSGAADKRGFGAVALTARQLAAGRALGGDYAGIEERLDRIRLMTLKVVEPGLQLPPLPPPQQVRKR